jgi:hypothetical protein
MLDMPADRDGTVGIPVPARFRAALWEQLGSDRDVYRDEQAESLHAILAQMRGGGASPTLTLDALDIEVLLNSCLAWIENRASGLEPMRGARLDIAAAADEIAGWAEFVGGLEWRARQFRALYDYDLPAHDGSTGAGDGVG